jgi:hypothetical protein
MKFESSQRSQILVSVRLSMSQYLIQRVSAETLPKA